MNILNLLLSELCEFDTFGKEKIPIYLFMDDLPEDYGIDTKPQAWHLKIKNHPKAKKVNSLPWL